MCVHVVVYYAELAPRGTYIFAGVLNIHFMFKLVISIAQSVGVGAHVRGGL